MFALCNSDEAKKVHVDVRKGCNFTDFNCTEVVVHNGTASVNLFVKPAPTPHSAEANVVSLCVHCAQSAARTRCPATTRTTCC